jgi:hypothetical protein
MAELMLDLGENLALYRGHPDELVGQDVNANVMTPEAFERLTETIRRDKRLEQLPFAVVRADKHELISGHHRRDSGKAAGLDRIWWLADTRQNMSRGTVVAKQLAHNSIHGEDDKATLALLYSELDTVDNVIDSFVTPKDFDSVGQLEPADAVDLGLSIDLKAMTLIFTPAVLGSLDRIEKWVGEHVPDDSDVVGVLPADTLARVRQVMLSVAKVEDVRSLGTVFACMCEIVEAHISGLQKGEDAGKLV